MAKDEVAELKARIRQLEKLLDTFVGIIRLNLMNNFQTITTLHKFLNKNEGDRVDGKSLEAHQGIAGCAEEGERSIRFLLDAYRRFKGEGGPGREPPGTSTKPVPPKKPSPTKSASNEEDLPE